MSAISGAGAALPAWTLYVGLAALAAGVLALILLLLPRRRTGIAEDLITSHAARTGVGQRYGGASASAHAVPLLDAEQALATATTAAAGVLRRSLGLEQRIARALEGAGSDLKPAEWLLAHLGITLAGGLLGLLLGGGGLGLLLLLVALAAPWCHLLARRGRRRRAFARALPGTLQLMSGSLSAGLSLASSVDTVAQEGADPLAAEFRRVLVENRLGVGLEDALEGVAERFESPDLAWVVMAIRIQHQVGGNLAELLDTVAATLREREYVRRQVATLSAEGRLSALVIGALPPVFTLYLLATDRSYLRPLLHDPRGVIMVVFGVVWLGIGAWWMSRLVRVEV